MWVGEVYPCPARVPWRTDEGAAVSCFLGSSLAVCAREAYCCLPKAGPGKRQPNARAHTHTTRERERERERLDFNFDRLIATLWV